MITSERELALGEDHNGIMVLPAGSAEPGDSGYEVLGLGDEVLDIAVTPDRGYALSIRGIAREVATAYDLPFADPALVDPESLLPAPSGEAPHGCSITDPSAADRFVAALDRRAGPERAQPAVDAPRARRVRDAPGLPGRGRHQLRDARARPAAARLRPGEAVRSADGAPGGRGRAAGDPRPREAHAERRGHRDRRAEGPAGAGRDDGRPRVRDRRRLALGGHRGGALLRARRGADVTPAQALQRGLASLRARGRPRARPRSRRRAPRPCSSSSGVPPTWARPGSTRCAPVEPVQIPADLPERISGLPISADRGHQRGSSRWARRSTVEGTSLVVTPPSWRPDLTDPADLVEEVVRLEGYENLPVDAAAGPRRATA